MFLLDILFASILAPFKYMIDLFSLIQNLKWIIELFA